MFLLVLLETAVVASQLKIEFQCKEVEVIVADSVNSRVIKTSLNCFDSESDSSYGSSAAARLSEFQTGLDSSKSFDLEVMLLLF